MALFNHDKINKNKFVLSRQGLSEILAEVYCNYQVLD